MDLLCGCPCQLACVPCILVSSPALNAPSVTSLPLHITSPTPRDSYSVALSLRIVAAISNLSLRRQDMAARSYKMAFPFPRLLSAPQTPKQMSDPELSYMAPPRTKVSLLTKTSLVVILAIVLLLWTHSPFNGYQVKTDGIPFSNNPVNE